MRNTESKLHWVCLDRPACICLPSDKSYYLPYRLTLSPSTPTSPPPPPMPIINTPTSYLPPISTVTDDEACELLRLGMASLSSLPAAARLLQQLEHNQVGLRTTATHTVAIPAPRGSCLHLCVGRYSSENLNQSTTLQYTHAHRLLRL